MLNYTHLVLTQYTAFLCFWSTTVPPYEESCSLAATTLQLEECWWTAADHQLYINPIFTYIIWGSSPVHFSAGTICKVPLHVRTKNDASYRKRNWIDLAFFNKICGSFLRLPSYLGSGSTVSMIGYSVYIRLYLSPSLLTLCASLWRMALA